MLACVAISTSFIISNSYILCLLISSDGLASLSCLSFFFNFLGVKYCLLPILISWAGMHHCTASASYFFQLREWSTGGRCKSKCEGEKLDHFYLQAQSSCFQAVSKTEQNPNKHTNKLLPPNSDSIFLLVHKVWKIVLFHHIFAPFMPNVNQLIPQTQEKISS